MRWWAHHKMVLLASSAPASAHLLAGAEGTAPATVTGVQTGYSPQPTQAALWLRSLLTRGSGRDFGFVHELSLPGEPGMVGGAGGTGGEGAGEKMLVLKSLLGCALAEWARLALQVCPGARRP